MASQPQPAGIRADRGSTNRGSQQFGGISLIRSQLAPPYAMLPNPNDQLPLNITPVAAVPDYSNMPEYGSVNSMISTNPYAGMPPIGRPGCIRNPNNPCDFLPNTQNILRGGFAPIPKYLPDGDPDDKYLVPHYPPMSNDFYELTSDGRLSEAYFENARIRKFRANPDLSILSAAFSPANSDSDGEKLLGGPVPVEQDRIYIGQGYWRQANEKVSLMPENKPAYHHKYKQNPTPVGIQPWKRAQRREPRNNEEFWRASEMMSDDDDTFQEPKIEQDGRGNDSQAAKQEGELQRSPRKPSQVCSIHQSAEGNKDADLFKRTESEADVRRQSREKNTLFERILVQHTSNPNRGDIEQDNPELRRDHAIYSLRLAGSKDQVIATAHEIQQEPLAEINPPRGSRHTNIPGDVSGYNSRMLRTSSDLEAMLLKPPKVPTAVNQNVSLRGTDSETELS